MPTFATWEEAEAFVRENMGGQVQAEEQAQSTYAIYQLRSGDDLRDYRFENLSRLKEDGRSVEGANYDEVYSGPFEPGMSLEGLFERFNIDRPMDFKGHSLSVSDIIVLNEAGEKRAFYVDSFGFAEVPEFLMERTTERGTQDMDSLMEEQRNLRNRIEDEEDRLNSLTQDGSGNDAEAERVRGHLSSLREELGAVRDRIDKFYEAQGEEYAVQNLPDEMAFKLENRYLTIQTSEEGYDYSIYDEGYHLLDGGIYEDPAVSIRLALDEIAYELRSNTYSGNEKIAGDIHMGSRLERVDYDELMGHIEAVGAGEIEAARRSAETSVQENPVPSDPSAMQALHIGDRYVTISPSRDGSGNYEYNVYDEAFTRLAHGVKEDHEDESGFGMGYHVGTLLGEVVEDVLMGDGSLRGSVTAESIREAVSFSYVEAQAQAVISSETPVRGNGEEPAGAGTADEISVQENKAESYRIHDDLLGTGGEKEKFWRNISAIRTLKQIEETDRDATPEEQEILSQYVGWGGLPDAFDEAKSGWRSEFETLKSLLSEDEYRAARASTLNAHYTSPVIIRAMYEKLADLGFKGGAVLEPSMGIGNFFGMMPDEVRDNSSLYGVELDSITGRIAQKLYPQANIQVKGFEKTAFPNNAFDVAVGNVPFGDYSLHDPQYDSEHFLIHDYFFAKSLDKVKPGGVVAFITSSGTMDKKNTEVREYIAKRADLLGAVRLPNNAFLANAGTSVTADILFLQKREAMTEEMPDWVNLGETADGIPVNSYFADRPDMILGKMEEVSGRFGMTVTCTPDESEPLADQLSSAMKRITGAIDPISGDAIDLAGRASVDAADVPAYSFFTKDGTLYFKEGESVEEVQEEGKRLERILDLMPIRDVTRELIRLQLDNSISDITIAHKREQLGNLYDAFVKKHGHIADRGNSLAFGDDASYPLLCSLENYDDDGRYIGKADIFTRRTVSPIIAPDHAESAADALAVSLNIKGEVDLAYMQELTGDSEEKLVGDLAGVLYENPMTHRYETADEYLSGNIRVKLREAESAAASDAKYAGNVEALKGVLPEWIRATDIEIPIGSTWLPRHYVEEFMHETFRTAEGVKGKIRVEYSNSTGTWHITGKREDSFNPVIQTTYGTYRRNAYELLESTLNLKTVRIYDTISGERRFNPKETAIANQKQDAIKEAFRSWLYSDPDRRHDIEEIYNETFNAVRPRQYDGSHLTFPGMSPAIAMREHQKDAIAHVLYGDSTLLAHAVGAGKTFEMVASAMESKRLGMCKKSLIAVPDHLTEQEGGDFLQLYPGAKVLIAKKKDFEPANRKKFCSRIATGGYDAIIMGHSQFTKIPLSKERQERDLEQQISEITAAAEEAKLREGNKGFSVKEMEKMRVRLQAKLERLKTSKQDDTVTFEELGCDRLFVDESHYFKNLYVYSKMSNVAGVQTSDSQKASDMYSKTRYINETTGGKGVVFATGTPVSNSMTELFTIMRYLMPDKLEEKGLSNFDSWASTFGQTVSAIELAPEGTGYRQKTRFAKFFNLPELMSMFKECADIRTADTLNLDVPEAEYVDVTLPASEEQKEVIEKLAERAQKIRGGAVKSNEDNMLAVTNDGRKLALDQRLFDEGLGEDAGGKTAACAENVYKIWESTREQRSAQLVFCDLSTPKEDGTYDVYNDIKGKLMERGVPAEEIAFIHDAKTDTQKEALFAKVRAGQIRVLLGSTNKMGAGTNVQKRLVALHHLDAPWRPSDIEQREGRIIRQGNENDKVQVYRYLKQGTFDAYMWQVLKAKQTFIGQIMTSKTPARSMDDIDDLALSYAEVMACCTDNPKLKEKMDLDVQVDRLKLAKSNYLANLYSLQDDISIHFPAKIKKAETIVAEYSKDAELYKEQNEIAHEKAKARAEARARSEREEKNRKRELAGKEPDKSPIEVKVKASDAFDAVIGGKAYTNADDAAIAVIDEMDRIPPENYLERREVGEYKGFKLYARRGLMDTLTAGHLTAVGAGSHTVDIPSMGSGLFRALDRELSKMPEVIERNREALESARKNLELAKEEVAKPFDKEEEYKEKLERLAKINAELGVGEAANEGVDIIVDDPEEKEKPALTDRVKITKAKDGGFNVSVKDHDITLAVAGIEKKTAAETMEEAEQIKASLEEAIGNALAREAEPVTLESYREDISRLSHYMNQKNRRTMTDQELLYALEKYDGLKESFRGDAAGEKVLAVLEGDKTPISSTITAYEKRDGMWGYIAPSGSSRYMGDSHVRDGKWHPMDKSSPDYLERSYRNMPSIYTLDRCADGIAGVIADVAKENFDLCKDNPDYVKAACVKAMESIFDNRTAPDVEVAYDPESQTIAVSALKENRKTEYGRLTGLAPTDITVQVKDGDFHSALVDLGRFAEEIGQAEDFNSGVSDLIDYPSKGRRREDACAWLLKVEKAVGKYENDPARDQEEERDYIYRWNDTLGGYGSALEYIADKAYREAPSDEVRTAARELKELMHSRHRYDELAGLTKEQVVSEVKENIDVVKQMFALSGIDPERVCAIREAYETEDLLRREYEDRHEGFARYLADLKEKIGEAERITLTVRGRWDNDVKEYEVGTEPFLSSIACDSRIVFDRTHSANVSDLAAGIVEIRVGGEQVYESVMQAEDRMREEAENRLYGDERARAQEEPGQEEARDNAAFTKVLGVLEEMNRDGTLTADEMRKVASEVAKDGRIMEMSQTNIRMLCGRQIRSAERKPEAVAQAVTAESVSVTRLAAAGMIPGMGEDVTR